MKRKLSVIISVFMIISMIAFAGGCSLFGGEETPAPDIELSDLIGTWTRETDQGTESYAFKEDMTCVHNSYKGSSLGEYSISGNELTEVYRETHTNRTHFVRFSEDKNTMYWGSGSTMTEYTRSK